MPETHTTPSLRNKLPSVALGEGCAHLILVALEIPHLKQEVHMTTRIAFTSSLFLAAMLLLPSSMASSAELTGACLKDAKAQCPGVTPGGGKIRDCLKTHIQDLSDDCKAVLVKAVNAKACADDAKKLCAAPLRPA
jgi:hypothetical protein